MRKTILVLDDDPISRAVFSKVLDRAGYRVVEMSTARDAIAHCRRHTGDVDLIVADVLLGDGWGTQAAAQMRQHCPAVPVLFTSGTPIEGWREKDQAEVARLGGGVDFLPKPFRSSTLKEKVEEMLETGGGCRVPAGFAEACQAA